MLKNEDFRARLERRFGTNVEKGYEAIIASVPCSKCGSLVGAPCKRFVTGREQDATIPHLSRARSYLASGL